MAPGFGWSCAAACFSADDKQVLTAAFDGTARHWHALTGAPIGEPMAHAKPTVFHARFGPNDVRVVTTCMDGVLRVWDHDAPMPIETFPPVPADAIHRLDQTADGRFLFVSSGRAWLWTPRWLDKISTAAVEEQVHSRLPPGALTITAKDALAAPLVSAEMVGKRADLAGER